MTLIKYVMFEEVPELDAARRLQESQLVSSSSTLKPTIPRVQAISTATG